MAHTSIAQQYRHWTGVNLSTDFVGNKWMGYVCIPQKLPYLFGDAYMRKCKVRKYSSLAQVIAHQALMS